MESLQTRFDTALKALGLEALPCPAAALAPAALRFSLIGTEKPYLADHRKPNGAYIQNALDRALEIYAALPAVPELLRIHRDREDADILPLSTLNRLGLPQPDETVSAGSREYFFWELPGKPEFLGPLFREIIRGELDAAGLEALCGSVCFLSTRQPLLFSLWDDREVTVAADRSSLLQPLSLHFRDWLRENG